MKQTVNIEEELSIREEYFSLSKELITKILNAHKKPVNQISIGIGGESGCGKSTTAICLEREFKNKGINCVTLHMDSYFNLPPKDNHQQRVKDIKNVGPIELNMDLLNSHIKNFKTNKDTILVPVVNYKENSFTNKELDLSSVDVIIVEGVYAFLAENLDFKIFLSRTYKDTFESRKKRTRENYDPFVESILEKEHLIVESMIKEADYIIDKDYKIRSAS